MKLKLVYIGQNGPRFIYGHAYDVIEINQQNILEYTSTIIDKDGHPKDFSNQVLYHWFRPLDKWRDEQIDKILE